MNTPINDGGPAFPFGQVSEVTGAPINGYHNDGMSLRDYFAAKALMGLLAGADWAENSLSKTDAAEMAYEIADAMLAARRAGAQ